MSARTFIIILIIIAVVGGAAFGFLYWWTSSDQLPLDSARGEPATSSSTAANFFPGGDTRVPPENQIPIIPTGATPSSTSTPTSNLQLPTSNFYQISESPIGGAFIAGVATSSPFIWSDRVSGNLYRVSSGGLAERLTNTTLTNIAALVGGQTGSSTILIATTNKDGVTGHQLASTTLPTVAVGENFLNLGDNLGMLDSKILSNNQSGWVVAPDQKQIFHWETAATGVRGIISDWSGQKPTTLFQSAYTGWQASWPTTKTIALQSRAGSGATGVLYLLDIKTKKLTRALGGVTGLTTKVGPDGDTIIFSATTNQSLITGLLRLKTNTTTRLPFSTLAEKCAFNRAGTQLFCAAPANLSLGNYPDDWYQGATNWQDYLWQVDVKTGAAKIVFNPTLANFKPPLDVGQLWVGSDDQTLYLWNRPDGLLWALNLREGF